MRGKRKGRKGKGKRAGLADQACSNRLVLACSGMLKQACSGLFVFGSSYCDQFSLEPFPGGACLLTTNSTYYCCAKCVLSTHRHTLSLSSASSIQSTNPHPPKLPTAPSSALLHSRSPPPTHTLTHALTNTLHSTFLICSSANSHLPQLNCSPPPSSYRALSSRLVVPIDFLAAAPAHSSGMPPTANDFPRPDQLEVVCPLKNHDGASCRKRCLGVRSPITTHNPHSCLQSVSEY
jgi:hypothetical protein